MAGISIICGFDVKEHKPIDSRLVATNSTVRLNTPYIYEGLKVYQTDNQLTYTWNGSTWIVEERGGIYGGSGSLVGDTFVDFGTISNSVSSESKDFVWYSRTSDNLTSYFYNNFVRHTSDGTISPRGIEFRQQYKYWNGSSLVDSSFISFNPVRPTGESRPGALAFSTGFGTIQERLRISLDGKVGIATIDPKEIFQIGTSSNSTTLAQPLVIHRGGSSVIGYNWYYANADNFFLQSHGSSKIIQTNDELWIQNRLAGSLAGSFQTTIFTTATASGRVGVRTSNPQVSLDVNGSINSNANITGVTISASARTNSPVYYLSGLQNTYMYTTPFITGQPVNTLSLVVRGTASFLSTGSQNYFIPASNFSDNVNIIGKVDINGNLTVKGTSSITNFEPFTTLTPTAALKTNTAGQFVTTISPLNNFFTYSFSAYRVGALVNVNINIRLLQDIQLVLPGEPFYGYMFKFNSDKFKPASVGYGSGSGNIGNGFNYFGIGLEVFQTEPINQRGGQATNVTGNEFYLRIRALNTGGRDGQSFIDNTSTYIPENTLFRGTITYKAGDISSLSTPTGPFFPSGGASLPALSL